MGCKHNFHLNYATSDFVCIKCGMHHSGVNYNSRGGRRRGAKVATLSIVVVVILATGGILWWQDTNDSTDGTAAIGDIILGTIDDIWQMASGGAEIPVGDSDLVTEIPNRSFEITNVDPNEVDPLVTDIPESHPDNTIPDPDDELLVTDIPESPLDRTIFPNGSTYGDLTSVQAQLVPHQEQEPEAESGPEHSKAEQIERFIHTLTNQYRHAAGIPPLEQVLAIDAIARSHSQDMLQRNYFSHDTPEGLDPTNRGNLAGYDCIKDYGSYYTEGLAENISWYSGTWYSAEFIAGEIVDGWMDSPGHRQNIMDPNYDRLGVGVAIDSGNVYATQNFC